MLQTNAEERRLIIESLTQRLNNLTAESESMREAADLLECSNARANANMKAWRVEEEGGRIRSLLRKLSSAESG